EERRASIVAQLSDPLEIGDAYGSMAWALHEVGRYEDAARRAVDGLLLVSGRGPNVQIHLLAWIVVTGLRLGRWDSAIERFGELQSVLDERREDPPYFAAHAYAAVG